ncbi:MAG: choice-of-anchor J domain-containing protein [Chloroflexota bacterium]|nr:choice-of-anchor J domain-containing protein [Chloroflexota bacterium]
MPETPSNLGARRTLRRVSLSRTVSALLLLVLLLLLRDTLLNSTVTRAASPSSVPAQADKYGQKDTRQEAPQSTEQQAGSNPQVPQGACEQTLIDEGFEVAPPSSWTVINRSSPQGSTSWFQGNPAIFPAHSGDPNSYVGANFNSTTGTNTISNWLISPEVPLQSGRQFVFWTRTSTDSPFGDRLQVRLSTAGASTNVGTTDESVGDFTTLLLEINPDQASGGYPDAWTQYVITLNNISGTQSGRFAFRYYVTEGGPTGDNSNYIGIDTVVYGVGCSCSIQFNDVPASGPGSTFYSFIRCLACRNIITGYECGGANEPCPGKYFRPGVNVTRGQISKMVAIAAGLSDPAGARKFQDVPEDSPFYLWIQQLANAGAISGYTCGGTNPATGAAEPCVAPGNLAYFRPNNNVTRGQLSKIVSEAAGLSDAPGAQQFADVPPGSTFFDWIQRLANNGVVSGYACGGTNPATGAPEPCDASSRPYFRLNNNVTRGQVAKIVAETFYPNCVTPARSTK